MSDPKWDGFRRLIFRARDNFFLQSRPGKSLTAAFPEIVAAVLDLNANHFVLDGEVAIPSHTGFSFDLLVNLRVSAARRAQEIAAAPAIHIAFDMLANSEYLIRPPLMIFRSTKAPTLTLCRLQHGWSRFQDLSVPARLIRSL